MVPLKISLRVARFVERKRFVTVDIDDLIAREEPTLGAAQDQDLAEPRAAMFKLPEEYREPLVLQVLMGGTTAEIAVELGLLNAAVLTRLFSRPQAAEGAMRRGHQHGSGRMIDCASYRRAMLADLTMRIQSCGSTWRAVPFSTQD